MPRLEFGQDLFFSARSNKEKWLSFGGRLAGPWYDGGRANIEDQKAGPQIKDSNDDETGFGPLERLLTIPYICIFLGGVLLASRRSFPHGILICRCEVFQTCP